MIAVQDEWYQLTVTGSGGESVCNISGMKNEHETKKRRERKRRRIVNHLPNTTRSVR